MADPHDVPADVPLVLGDVQALTSAGSAGVLWALSESGRQLDANVVRLAPHQVVDMHAEPDLDVLVLVVGGHGVLGTTSGNQTLSEGTLLWLPHGARRSLAAGESGMNYLTVHQRRPGMRITFRE